MGTTALTPIDPTSVDAYGLSVATSFSDNPRSTIYDPTTLAAAAPVWFHPLNNGRHLMLNARRWHAATPAGGPGGYSDHTEDLTPTWCIVHGPSGVRDTVPGYPMAIPVNANTTSRTLVGAASRGGDYLYLLYAATMPGDIDGALLQVIRATPTGGFSVTFEEVFVPTVTVGGDEVIFDKGIQFHHPHICLYGTDSLQRVYRMRKLWATIGTTRLTGGARATAYVPSWEYYTGTGYSLDPAQIEALPFTSAGPVRFGSLFNRSVISTVIEEGSLRKARLYTSRSGRPYVAQTATIALGSVADDSYLGHGLVFMDTLSAYSAANAVPYVISTKAVDEDDNEALVNTWSLQTLSP